MSLDSNHQYMKITVVALLTFICKASSDRHTFSFTITDPADEKQLMITYKNFIHFLSIHLLNQMFESFKKGKMV